ncbi:24743_t:CDS:2, partial [Dentiscutata erythropus]
KATLEKLSNTLTKMESTLYLNFVKYLTISELPPNLTLKKQQQFKKQATYYIEFKLLAVLYRLHSDLLARHFGINETYN